MKLKNKNVLITGGLGFIGSNLAIKLVELGANVTVLDSLIPEYGGVLQNVETVKDKIKINFSDVRDKFSIKYLIKNQDFLFNLAGQTSHMDSMTNPFQDLEINAKAQLSILEACRAHNPDIKIVFASTRQLYGKPQYLPVDENHPIIPVDVNGINKMSGENYHLLYNNVYGIKTSVLRLTNTYGPRLRIKDARQTFLGIWIRNVIEDKPFLIFGDGLQVRDYNYVDDVVDAFILCALSEKTNGHIYNLGDSNPINLKETASILIEENRKGTYEMIPFPEDRKSIDIGDFYANFDKISQDLGWYPKTSFREGIRETLAYYKQNMADYI
ncbi:GDP-mannose 4,6-dehydratase [Flavivirga eckloniae]|uniref:NAD-dependent epimerase n=1 Tax=Flavivirga eckloniae TaxID=1803846 RepID=A0A2K9PVH6_9FLAO|nr:GDP-mannose 4,6-dehydratase [Flavivirga eckloniae]AUP81063.1 NAD-dependent epimerase [Flavivirga eckloniae]